MSDIQILFAKSLMHMQLPQGILSLGGFRSGDSRRITSKNIKPTYRKIQKTYLGLDPFLDLPISKSEHQYSDPLKQALKGKAEHFTLCPSDNSQFLDSSLEKQANILERTAVEAESIRIGSLGPSSSSKLIISKLFEFFENPEKNHNLCYFSIKNSSNELLAYSFTTNHYNGLYVISPGKVYVPPRHSMEISIKFLGNEFTLEQLEKDQILITSFCAGHETTKLMDFIHPKSNFDSSTTIFPLKAFVRHPSGIVPSNQTSVNQSTVKFHLESDPKALKARHRFKKLRDRNYSEKIFDRIQATAEHSKNELEKYERQVEATRIFFSILSYATVVLPLGFCLYYATCGRLFTKPPEPQSIFITCLKYVNHVWIETPVEFIVDTFSNYLIWDNPSLSLIWDKMTQYFSNEST